MFLPLSQNLQAQVVLGEQLARQTDAFFLVLDRHLFAAHPAGPVKTVSRNLHAAYAATATPATHRYALTAELFHRLEDVTLRRAGKFLTSIFNYDYEFFYHVIIEPTV